jgi:hypothetical protein
MKAVQHPPACTFTEFREMAWLFRDLFQAFSAFHPGLDSPDIFPIAFAQPIDEYGARSSVCLDDADLGIQERDEPARHLKFAAIIRPYARDGGRSLVGHRSGTGRSTVRRHKDLPEIQLIDLGTSRRS